MLSVSAKIGSCSFFFFKKRLVHQNTVMSNQQRPKSMFQRFISYLDPNNASSSDYLSTNNAQPNNPYQTNPNQPVYTDTSDDDSSTADFQPPPPPPSEFSNSGIKKHMSQEIIVGDNVLQDKTTPTTNSNIAVNRKLSTNASKYVEQ